LPAVVVNTGCALQLPSNPTLLHIIRPTIFELPDDLTICTVPATALTIKVKTRGRLGYPGEIMRFQDGRQLPPDFENLEHTRGNPKFGNLPGKNSSETYKT